MRKPSPEEKVAHCLRRRLSIYNRLRKDVFVISSDFGGSVTEEGKRTCPFADRPIQEALRLPSSVTAPSPREKAFVREENVIFS